MELERVTVSIEKDLLDRFDRLVASQGHANRSEAIRDLVRRRLLEAELAAGRGEAVATVTLVYDHAKRELAERLVETGHHHHGSILASMHVHLDDRHCLETIALRGEPGELRHIAEHMIGMKGVLHGEVVLSSTSF